MFDYITIFIAQFIIAFIENKFSFPRIKSKNNIGETNDIEESKYYRKKLSFTSNIFNVINYWLFHLAKNYKFYEIIKTEYILLDERSILFENGKRPTYFVFEFRNFIWNHDDPELFLFCSWGHTIYWNCWDWHFWYMSVNSIDCIFLSTYNC